MKKFLGIVIIGLLMSDNLYADSKVDKALENCADRAYYTKPDNSLFPSSLYFFNPEYKKINKENEEIKIKIKEADDKNSLKIDNWMVENPSPKMGDFKNINTSIGSLEWPEYDEAIKKYFKAELKFLNEITKEIRFIKEKQNVLKDRIDTIIRFSALVYIKDSDLSLKIKVKSVVGYVDHYKNCEIEYKSTPSSFLLEWED